MSLTVIVPTRGRPQSIRPFTDAFWSAASRASTRLAFAVDEDDPKLGEYDAELMGVLNDPWNGWTEMLAAPRMRMGPTLNRWAMALAHNAMPPDVIGFAGDDHRFRSAGWDQRVGSVLAAAPGVAYGDDLVHGPNLPTAAFMSASIIRALGYMSPPGLKHMYIDNAFLEIGKATNLHYLADVVVEHLHPIVGKAVEDDGYREAATNMGPDEAEFKRWLVEEWPADRMKLHG